MFYETHIKCEIISPTKARFRVKYYDGNLGTTKIDYILYFDKYEYQIVKNNTNEIITKDFHLSMQQYNLKELQ